MTDSTTDIPDTDQFLWLVVIGFFLGFVYAFGIGANDVANSFASTVAAKSLTLAQAVAVASIFEFLGSFLLGASVTGTIRSGIFDVTLYADRPDILILGYTTSIFAASIMLLVATFYGLPVSTTHTVVGTLMGFTIVAKGFDSVNWKKANQIFISWAVSPMAGGVVAFVFFALVKYLVLGYENAYDRAYHTFPIVLIIGVGINVFYIVYKGMNNLSWTDDIVVWHCIVVGLGMGVICALLWLYPFGPIVKRRLEKIRADEEQHRLAAEKAKELAAEAAADRAAALAMGIEIVEKEVEKPDAPAADEPAEGGSLWQRFKDNTVNQDLETQALDEDSAAKELWATDKDFDRDAEYLFGYVQVFTACLNSFAHGANDVANAIGPLSGLLMIYQTGEVSKTAGVQKWILAYGGVGIVLGLLIFGYRVMKSLGYKVCVLSASRGACAELASSLFVVTASFFDIPVSSTQSITGAVTGIGCVAGFRGVNWLFFGRVCVGWVVIFFTAALFSAMMFAMFAYTPSLV